MDKKFNLTTNQKHPNYNPILNLKSSSQKINQLNYGNEQNFINNNNKISNSIGDINKNNLINLSQIDKSSNSNNKNQINDDSSLDNISNIIKTSPKKLPCNQMIFEDNKSSLFDNNNQGKSSLIPRITDISDNSGLGNKNVYVCDSHTRSFQLKMKKMKEMNSMIIKENKILNDSNKSENTYKSSKLNYLKSKINCKQKLISMKNKNKLIGNINDFNSFNIHLKEINKNNNINNNDEIKSNEINTFLCC